MAPPTSPSSAPPPAPSPVPVYDRLVLRIGADPESPGGLVTEVIDSPVGQTGRAPFRVPLAAQDLARLAAGMEEVARRHVRPASKGVHLRPSPGLDGVGRSLGEALFAGPVADALLRSQEKVDAHGGRGLRIELRIDPRLEQAATLHALPWELMVAPRGSGPLSLSRRTTVVRFLELPQRGRPPDRPERMRILVVAPRPRGLEPLDQGRELDELHRSWWRSGRVVLETVEPPTLEALRDALRNRSVHGLHFMGHGRFDPDRGLGELLFEDEAGEQDPVDAGLLAGQVEDFADRIRIVVLNACQSARPGALDPGLGVAQALVAAGVPAVVAMQFPVSDRAAIAFSRHLYRSLAEGDPVDAAVAEGRQAIVRDVRDSPEWATPALFLAAGDGMLFGAKSARKGWVRRLAGGIVVSLIAGLLVTFLATKLWREAAPAQPVDREQPAEVRNGGAEKGSEAGSEPGAAGGDATFLRSAMVPETKSEDEAEAEGTSTARPLTEPADHVPDAAPPIHAVADGETVRLPEVDASVHVDFQTYDGVGFVLLAVSPDGEAVLKRPLMGPQTVEVETGGRTLSIHVLGIDFDRRTVELRASRSP